MSTALRGALLALLVLAAATPTWAAEPASPPAKPSPTRPLSAEERALLRDLELLMELELLRDWDPDSDLPIPADPAQANAVAPEEPR